MLTRLDVAWGDRGEYGRNPEGCVRCTCTRSGPVLPLAARGSSAPPFPGGHPDYRPGFVSATARVTRPRRSPSPPVASGVRRTRRKAEEPSRPGHEPAIEHYEGAYAPTRRVIASDGYACSSRWGTCRRLTTRRR